MYFCQYGVLRKGGTSAMLAIELAPIVLVVEASSPGCAVGLQKCTKTRKPGHGSPSPETPALVAEE
jgi:hypothetical protein